MDIEMPGRVQEEEVATMAIPTLVVVVKVITGHSHRWGRSRRWCRSVLLPPAPVDHAVSLASR